MENDIPSKWYLKASRSSYSYLTKQVSSQNFSEEIMNITMYLKREQSTKKL
jgi:hypothetical protein